MPFVSNRCKDLFKRKKYFGVIGTLRPSTSETTLSVQEEEKDTIVHQLSTPRGIKKSLKSLPRGVRKAANNIKHYKTTADSVPEFPTLYGDDIKGRKQRRELSSPACGTIFTERRSTCRSVCCQQSSCCSSQKRAIIFY